MSGVPQRFHGGRRQARRHSRRGRKAAHFPGALCVRVGCYADGLDGACTATLQQVEQLRCPSPCKVTVAAAAQP